MLTLSKYSTSQIFALQTRNSTSIPFAAKEVAEVFVELWRSPVEVVELF